MGNIGLRTELIDQVTPLTNSGLGPRASGLGPPAFNRQRPVTWLRRIHSLYPKFVNTRCKYAFISNLRSLMKVFKDELKTK